MFKQDVFYYPYTRYVDSFADVMMFAGKVLNNDVFYGKVINRIFGNDEFEKIEDLRLISHIYLNLTSGSVKYLNPDYVYNLATELYYLTEGNIELNKNYFIQVNKFTIFSILSSFGDYYNLAEALSEYNIVSILNNKYSGYNYIPIYKLVANGFSYDFESEFDQDILDNALVAMDVLFKKGSQQYFNIVIGSIKYCLKFKKSEQALELWKRYDKLLIDSDLVDNDTKVSLMFYMYKLFNKNELIKNNIVEYAKSNYLTDRRNRAYVYILSQI